LVIMGVLAVSVAQAELKIDFTQTGDPVQAGFQGYFANHEQAATFTAQSYSAFGTTITVTPSWQPGAPASAMQMIDRGGGSDAPDLLRDWIGTDNRGVGDPMVLTISGLPAGTYNWLSYHHDTDNQTGVFDVNVTDATGTTRTTDIDITDLDGDGVSTMAAASKFATQIVSDGSDITFEFDLQYESGVTPVPRAFFVMSGFEIINAALAGDPDPEDGSQTPPMGPAGDGVFILLKFEPGVGAVSHTAYFSENRAEVESRDSAVSLGSPPFPGTIPNGYYVGLDAEEIEIEWARTPLETGKIYYWAVDESDGTTTYEGPVWSFMIVPEQAWDPTPADGDIRVNADPGVTLAWKKGTVDITNKALTYSVYYGTDKAAVETSTTHDANGLTATNYVTAALAANTVYYWRVDTVVKDLTSPPFDETVLKGDVWQFKTLPAVAIVDPDLIAWYQLEGGVVPGVAFDSSGFANHGLLRDDAHFAAGYIGNALALDGDGDYVDCGNSTEFDITTNITVACWIKAETLDKTWQAIVTKGDNTWRLHRGSTTQSVNWATSGMSPTNITGSTNVNDGEWHHIAGTYNGNDRVLYVDGRVDVNDVVPGAIAVGTYPVNIGENAQAANRHWSGLIDDVRVYKKTLSLLDIKVLSGILQAVGPDPADGATGVPRMPTLSWEAGAYMAAVNGNLLYLSSDEDQVLNRTVAAAPLSDTNYPVPAQLDLSTEYYWAVDTVNEGELWPGDVWSLTTLNYLDVDDMETYTAWDTADNNIFEVWVDGMGNCRGSGNDTGANVFESAGTGVGGSQAMQCDYDNDGMVLNPCLDTPVDELRSHLYSKIEAQVLSLPSGVGANWTVQGVKVLSLWFYGDPANVVEPMWVELSDTTTNKAKVIYGTYTGEEAADIAEASWHEWLIDLGDFAGVNLADVKSVAIGIGTEGSMVPGGSGGRFHES